jgi:hypothetical protein
MAIEMGCQDSSENAGVVGSLPFLGIRPLEPLQRTSGMPENQKFWCLHPGSSVLFRYYEDALPVKPHRG